MNTNSDINAALAFGPYHGQAISLSIHSVKRTIGRTGLCIDGVYYYAPEMMAHLDETVLVKVAPNGSEVAYFSLEEEFLGTGRQTSILPGEHHGMPNTSQDREHWSFFSRLIRRRSESK